MSTKATVENRYSRQIYAIGATAVRRLIQSKVVLIGLTATGAEMAKNILLSGCPDLKLYDPTPVSPADLESNYFVGKDQIGLPRANAVLSSIGQLNPAATVTVLSSLDSLVTLMDTSAVAIVDPLRCGIAPPQLTTLLDELHTRGTPVTLVETWGLCARVFNDFGPRFVVEDPLGEDPATLVAVRLERVRGEEELVLLELDVADHLLALSAGDIAVVSDNTGERRLILVADRKGSNTLLVAVNPPTTLGQGAEYSPADADFWNKVDAQNLRVSVTELIRPTTVAFRPFSDARRREPKILTSFIRNQNYFHCLFEAMHRDGAQVPRLRNADDADHFWRSLGGVAPVGDLPPEELAKVFAETAAAELVGMAAFIGGVASQEVLKGVTGRFDPVQQFWYADQLSCVTPHDLPDRPMDEPRPMKLPDVPADFLTQPMPSHRAVFGNLDNFRNANLFVIGAGAIGCEYLKNLACLGVGTGPKGRITVTDNDSIEVSNLSRQFLFREQHVGHNKAVTAAAAITARFPKVKIRALTDKVCRATSDPVTGIFNARFWSQTTVICNAVDNMAAREFLDDRAVEYRRPMIDSGTQGPRGHVEVFAPFVTKRFRDESGPTDQGKKIPFCTLHFFPTAIEHCIQYASDFFNQTFSATPTDVTRCLQAASPAAFSSALEASSRPAMMGNIHATVCRHFPTSVADALAWARGLYELTFVHSVRRILENYPLDKLDEDGKPYWSGARRAPNQPTFSVDDVDALTFVSHAALLWLRVHYGPHLHQRIPSAPTSFEEAEVQARQFFSSGFFVPLPAYVPTKVVIDEKKDDEANQQVAVAVVAADDVPFDQWFADIDAHKHAYPELTEMHPEVFEKDDDSNGHVGLITAIANLRAKCYSIAPETRMKVKKIAGKIVPAMITTTAVVTGLATLALCRLLSAGVNGTLTPLRWRQAVDGTDSSVVWLSNQDQLYQAFIPGEARRLPLFEYRRTAESDRFVSVPGSPTFTCWDRIDVRGTLSTSILDVIAEVKKQFHGVDVQQLVEASSDQWVYDGTQDAQSVGGFSLALWTQKFLKITDEQLDARGHLLFIVKCSVPVDISAAHPRARVNPVLPPLVFMFK